MRSKIPVNERIRGFRMSKGWTLRKMSEKTGLSPATLCNIERGLTAPTVQTAKAIGKVMRVDWSWLCL